MTEIITISISILEEQHHFKLMLVASCCNFLTPVIAIFLGLKLARMNFSFQFTCKYKKPINLKWSSAKCSCTLCFVFPPLLQCNHKVYPHFAEATNFVSEGSAHVFVHLCLFCIVTDFLTLVDCFIGAVPHKNNLGYKNTS